MAIGLGGSERIGLKLPGGVDWAVLTFTGSAVDAVLSAKRNPEAAAEATPLVDSAATWIMRNMSRRLTLSRRSDGGGVGGSEDEEVDDATAATSTVGCRADADADAISEPKHFGGGGGEGGQAGGGTPANDAN